MASYLVEDGLEEDVAEIKTVVNKINQTYVETHSCSVT